MLNQLRFDGLYVADLEECLSFIRFYEDGSLASASVSRPATASQVWVWLGQPDGFESRGTYQLNGPEIEFDSTQPGSFDLRDGTEFPEVRVNYKGSTLVDGALSLHSRSEATGHEMDAIYRFEPIGEPSGSA